MTNHIRKPRRVSHPATYRRAVGRLEEALARARERQQEQSAFSECDKIDQARLALFGTLAE
jgi:hypothetical protein